jgi:hypothetical protein
MSEECLLISDVSLPTAVSARLAAGPADRVWTPVDFLDLGSRASVDKVLQRLVAAGALRRIERGLYDTPRANRLTGQRSVPDEYLDLAAGGHGEGLQPDELRAVCAAFGVEQPFF